MNSVCQGCLDDKLQTSHELPFKFIVDPKSLTVFQLGLPLPIIKQEKHIAYLPLFSSLSEQHWEVCWCSSHSRGMAAADFMLFQALRQGQRRFVGSYENNRDAFTTWKHTDFKVLEILDRCAIFLTIFIWECRNHLLFFYNLNWKHIEFFNQKSLEGISLAIKLSWSA